MIPPREPTSNPHRGPSSTAEPPLDAHAILTQLYWTAVRAAAPGPALRAALAHLPAPLPRPTTRLWIIAIGKAARAMTVAAVDALAAEHREPAGGIVIAAEDHPSPHPALEYAVGDHPIPGARSFAAAARLADLTRRVKSEDHVWMLLSGGATSLAAGPDGNIPPDDLTALYQLLLGSGLAIAEMNLVRKRFSRWGAGRLAVALAPARVRNYIVSDVLGDDIAAIGSGPCVPDPSTAAEIHALLERADLWTRVPRAMRSAVEAAERDPSLETPKPGNDAFASVDHDIIGSNRLALQAIAARATELGYAPEIVSAALEGEASAAGEHLAAALLARCSSSTTSLAPHAPAAHTSAPREHGRCLIWGGETTVTLGPNASGHGGRSQELALAAARTLARSPHTPGATLLAAGTDGRDGPTDAAGAIVDGSTWDVVRASGRDPERDLAAHDAYPALDAAGALLHTGLTGTNMMDVAIGICT